MKITNQKDIEINEVNNINSDNDFIQEYLTTKSDKAANLFVREYQSFVYQIAMRYLKNIHDAEEIAQDVLIKALDNLESFKFNSNIKTWLYRICVNHSKNFLAKKKLRNIFNFFEDSEVLNNYAVDYNDGHKLLENMEFKERFYKSMEKLPEKQRETFALRYFDDLTYEEISDLLGTSVGGLKANYFQAVKKLGVLLNEK